MLRYNEFLRSTSKKLILWPAQAATPKLPADSPESLPPFFRLQTMYGKIDTKKSAQLCSVIRITKLVSDDNTVLPRFLAEVP